MWGMFMDKSAEFLAHYHKRSNVETTFTMVKRKFGASVRSRGFTAQVTSCCARCSAITQSCSCAQCTSTGSTAAARGMSDLTLDEQGNVRPALRFLHRRCGTWETLAKALRVNKATLLNLMGSVAVSVRVAFLVALFVGVPIDDLLAGRHPLVGTCPHCGQPIPTTQ